jgi:hypothetical protein
MIIAYTTARIRAVWAIGLTILCVPVLGACSTRSVPAPAFAAMPLPGSAYGLNLTTILGPVTGTGSRSVTVGARRSVSVTLGCLGRGLVWVRSPVGSFAAACGNGGVFAGGLVQQTHMAAGQRVTMRIIAPAHVTWELRVDGTPLKPARAA